MRYLGQDRAVFIKYLGRDGIVFMRYRPERNSFYEVSWPGWNSFYEVTNQGWDTAKLLRKLSQPNLKKMFRPAEIPHQYFCKVFL